MVIATTESILKASLDGSGVSKGAQQIEAALAKVASAAERAEKANDRLIKSNEAVAKAQQALAAAQQSGATEAAAKAAERLAAAQEKATASAAKHAAAVQAQTKAETELARAQEGGTKRVTESANSYEKLRSKIDSAFAAQMRMQQQQESINKAFERGAVTDKQRAELLGILSRQHSTYDAALKKTNAGLKEVADSSGLTFQQTQVLRAGFVNLFQTIAAGGSPLGAVITQSAQIVGGLGALSIALAAGAATGAIFALTAVKMTTAIAQSGDEVTKVIGRFTALTGSGEAARKIYDGLYQSSLQTGVAVSESAKAFTRFSLAAENIGATRSEVQKLNDTVSKSAILAGSSTSEAQAAAQQLGQALASGKLAGDEFRSVMENAPLLAQALARELGVSQGELRKMSEEGKITAEKVFPALLRASDEINASFAKMPLTMERAGNQATVAWENFKARLDENYGISQKLAAVLASLANTLTEIGPKTGMALLEESFISAANEARKLNLELERTAVLTDRSNPDKPKTLGLATGIAAFGTPVDYEDPSRAVLRNKAANAAMDSFNALTMAASADAYEEGVERVQAGMRKIEGDRAKSAALSKSIQMELDKEFSAREKLNKQTAEINEMYDKSAKGADDLALKNKLLKAATDAYTESVYKSSGAKKADAEAAREQGAALREVGNEAQNASKGMAAFFERMSDKQMAPGAKLLDDFSDAQARLREALEKSQAVLSQTPKTHKEYAEAVDKVTQAKKQLQEAETDLILVQAEAEKLDRKLIDAAYESVNALEQELQATMGGSQSLAEYTQKKREAALYSEVYEKVLKAELAVTQDLAVAQERAKAAGDRAVTASKGLENQKKQSAAQQEFARENERLADRFTDTLTDGIMSAFEQGTDAGKSMFDTLKNLGKTALKSAIATGLSELLRGTVTDLIGSVRGAFSATSVRSGAATAGGSAGGGLASLFGGGGGTGGGISGIFDKITGSIGNGSSGAGGITGGLNSWLFGSASSGNAANPASFVPGSSGVLGSGGGLFGNSSLNVGTLGNAVGFGMSAFNFAQNPSISSGLGLVGSGMGALSALGAIGPAFGPIGMGVSLVASLLGGLGGNKVKHPGMGIELMLGEAGLELGKTTGKHMDTSGARPMGQAAIDAINKTVSKVTGGSVGTGTGQQVYGLSYDGTVKKYRAVGEGLAESTQYETIAEAISAVTVSALKNLPITGLADNVATALKNSSATSLEEIKADLDFAKGFKESLALMNSGMDAFKGQAVEVKKAAADAAEQWQSYVDGFKAKALELKQAGEADVNAALVNMMKGALGLVEASKPLEGYALAYEQAKENIKALEPVLLSLGLTAEQVANMLSQATEKSRGQLVTQQNTDLRTQYLQLTDPATLAMEDLKKWRDEQIAQAKAIGNSEAANWIEKIFGFKQQEIVNQYGAAAESSGNAAKDAAKKMTSLEKALRSMVDDMTVRTLRVQQKSREAALAAYDVQARNETENAPVGTNLTWLKALQAAERAQIDFDQSRADYVEGIDRQIRAIQDQKETIQEQIEAAKAQAEASIQLAKDLKRYSDDLKLNRELSPLSPEAMLAEADTQLTALYERAKGGDLEAGQQFQAKAEQFLGINKDYFASSAPYSTAFDRVQTMLADLGKVFGGDTAMAQLEELIRQGSTLDAQLAALEDQKEWATRLGERQLASIDDLKTQLVGAFAAFTAAQAQLAGAMAGARAGGGGGGGARGAANSNQAIGSDGRPVGLLGGGLDVVGQDNTTYSDWSQEKKDAWAKLTGSLGISQDMYYRTGQDAVASGWSGSSVVGASGKIYNSYDEFKLQSDMSGRVFLEYLANNDLTMDEALRRAASAGANVPGIQGKQMGGIVGAYANGGMVGNGIWNQDSVLAKFAGGGHIALAGGEFVVPAPAVTPETLPSLEYMQRTGRPPANDSAGSSAEMIAELRALRDEVRMLRAVSAQGAVAVASAVQDGNAMTAEMAASARLANAAPRRANG